MKKSLTKQIEELKVELAHAQGVSQGYRDRAIAAEEKIKEGERNKFNLMEREYRNERDKSEVLTEIVRWLIDPEATKDPFGLIKAREEERKMRGL